MSKELMAIAVLGAIADGRAFCWLDYADSVMVNMYG